MIFIFWMSSFKPAFSVSSLSSRGSLVLLHFLPLKCYHLRLSVFLMAVLIPACDSSSPAFRMMYSAYKLKKQGDNIQPWCTPFPIWNQSIIPCPVLTVASWPAYRFLWRQVRRSSIPVSLRIFRSLLWSTQSRLWCNQAEVNFFLEVSCFFDDPTDVGNLISGSSAFSKFSLNTWKLLVHILLKPVLSSCTVDTCHGVL